MQCKVCNYSLANLPEHRCPECGLVFDPADSSTFETTATLRAKTGRWLLKVALYIPFAILLTFGIGRQIAEPRPEALLVFIVSPLLIAYYGFRVFKTRPRA